MNVFNNKKMSVLKTKSFDEELNDLAATEITSKTILLYFATFNTGEYGKTAKLFSENGELHPPFDKPIIGKQNIANYLEKEAPGIKLIPKQGTEKEKEYEVTGTVQTPLFSVNIQWNFMLNGHGEIESVKVKLLAKLEDLLNLKEAKAKDLRESVS